MDYVMTKCMNRFNVLINRFSGNNENQLKLIEVRIKVIKLNQEQED